MSCFHPLTDQKSHPNGVEQSFFLLREGQYCACMQINLWMILKIFVMFGVTLSGRTSDRQVRTELKMHYFLSTVLQLTYETTAAVGRCECLRELAREEVDIPITWR